MAAELVDLGPFSGILSQSSQWSAKVYESDVIMVLFCNALSL